MTAACTTVLVLFDSAIFTTVVITLTLEIFSMATSAEWPVFQLVRIIATIDTATYRPFVTAITTGVSSMIAWVVTIR